MASRNKCARKKLNSMRDPLTTVERSALMAKVRSRGNRSTEARVEAVLKRRNLKGWMKHPSAVPGTPDFYFRRVRLAVFVNGCFWHACPRCGRLPKSRVTFWKMKINGNRLRDSRTRRHLWKRGYHVLSIWEHELATDLWMKRLLSMITKLQKSHGTARGELR